MFAMYFPTEIAMNERQAIGNPPTRNFDVLGPGVVLPGFQHADTDTFVLRKPNCESEASGAAADDNIVK